MRAARTAALGLSAAWLVLLGGVDTARATCLTCTPVQSLYDQVGAPLLELASPSLDALRSEVGPAVLVEWTNPGSLPQPKRIQVLKGLTGGSLEEVWSCDEPASGCGMTTVRDTSPFVVLETYDYQVVVSDGVGEGRSNVASIKIYTEVPAFPGAVRIDTGEVEVSWRPSAGALAYRVVRTHLLDNVETWFEVDASVSKFVDFTADPGASYEYAIRACTRLFEGACDPADFYVTTSARLGVGGENAIHGLDEWVARRRFRPLDVVNVSTPLPSERLIYRDEGTGAEIFKLTGDPHDDYHVYSNFPVWSSDGSQVLFDSGRSFHWSHRIMEADGTNIRDIHESQLELSSTVGFRERWSRSEPDLLYYFNRAGEIGRMRIASGAATQQDLGLFWTAPIASDSSFNVIVHPDGTRLLASLEEADATTTAYLIDVDGVVSDVVMDLTDELSNQVRVHQSWFLKDDTYGFTFNRKSGASAAGDRQWVVQPLSDPGESRVVSDTRLTHAAPAPGGERIAHLSPLGVGATNVDSATMLEIAPGLDGHQSWDVDEDWFVASDRQALWRVWRDGHKTLIATPYTELMYEGEFNALFQPQISPDGTKMAFKSPMHGNIDLYAAVMQLPDPPVDPVVMGGVLEWGIPDHSAEIASYNVWESATSGSGYALLGTLDAQDCFGGTCQYTPGHDPSAFYYRVTAVEHSDLEGMPSGEAAGPSATGLRRLWLEPHEGCAGRPMAPVFDPQSTGLYHLAAVDDYLPAAVVDEGCPAGGVGISVPPGSYWLWALTRGGSGASFQVFEGADGLGSVSADDSDFAWVPIDSGTLSLIDDGELVLVPSGVGAAVDQILLTTDAAFVPSEIAKRLHVQPPSLPGISGLSATAGLFRCDLDWSDTAAENLSHYDVYASSDPSQTSWDQHRLVASSAESEFIDSGLLASTQYRYRVAAVDRHGNRGPLAAATCTTDAIQPYSVEPPPTEPDGSFAPDPVTGAWTFDYDIPPGASPQDFVAWVRVHSVTGRALSDDLERTVAGATLPWRLQDEITAIVREIEGPVPPPAAYTPLWVFVSLATSGDLGIYRSSPLATGPGQVTLSPVAGQPMSDLRVTGFVLTNDLGFLPEGLSDYLLVDGRGGLDIVPPRAQCDDGLDNDGDGLFDLADPGCDDDLDPSERSLALACDDGVDNDGDLQLDFLGDPGCDGVLDSSEYSPGVQCDDGIDNDDDGEIDLDDPDCLDSEVIYEEIPECDDGVDNDGDGFVDHPVEPGCLAPADRSERYDCGDGIDNDRDGLTDYPDDPGCESAASEREDPACSDGLDNDGDGRIDHAGGPGGEDPDPACEPGPHWFHETQAELVLVGCGLGFELIGPLALLMVARSRRRRSRPRA